MTSPRLTRTTLVFAVLSLLIGTSRLSMAANHYICPAATGANTGADWTNAYTGIGTAKGNAAPGSMVRGDTYFVANGQITPASSTTVFSVGDSGTSVITVQAATDANHGTSTGWTSGGTGACHQGQATFGPLQFSSDYWTLNGSYNDLVTAPSNNSSSYGFSITNGSGGTPINSTAVITNNGTNNTFKYLDVAGPGNTKNSSLGDSGIQTGQTGSGGPTYIGYSHLHDSSIYACCKLFGETGDVIEYNWIENNCCVGGAAHRGGINPAVYYSVGETDLTIRYNYFENLDGTAYIDWANAPTGNATHTNIYIYGNVAFCNTSDPHYNGNACAGGNGWIAFLGNTSPTLTYDNVNVYNNTVDGLLNSQGACGVGIYSATFNNLTVQNNLFSQCSANPPLCGQNGAVCTGATTIDSNTFWNVGSGNTWGTNIQTLSSNPYTSAGNHVAGQNNYKLATDTSNWYTLSNVTMGGFVETLAVDIDQAPRVTSRGAYQFTGAASNPNPPTALAAVVN